MEVVFVNVLILFMLLFLGFILGRKKIIAYSSIKDLTNLLIDVSIPCTIVVSLIRPYSSLLMKNTGEVFVVVMVYHLAVAAIAYFLSGILKVDPKKRGSWIFALVFSNNGFMGYPLMYALYGSEGLFIMAMGNVAQNVLIFSLGLKIVTMNYGGGDKIKLRSIIFTKQNIAVVIGLIIFVTQLAVPKPIVTLLTYVSNLTVPLSMMVVGMSLSRYEVKHMFTDKEVYRLTLVRMIIFPALMVVAFKLLHINISASLPMAILFYTAALPSPAFTSIMAERYNTSIGFASKCVFVTTILSVLTVPFFAGLL